MTSSDFQKAEIESLRKKADKIRESISQYGATDPNDSWLKMRERDLEALKAKIKELEGTP